MTLLGPFSRLREKVAEGRMRAGAQRRWLPPRERDAIAVSARNNYPNGTCGIYLKVAVLREPFVYRSFTLPTA